MNAESVSSPVDLGAASPSEGVNALLRHVVPVGTVEAEAGETIGRVLAAAVRSDRPSPAGNVSAMDGFAVCAADISHGVIPVEGESRAGRRPEPLAPGRAQRISTGALLPPGADAVVRAEDARLREGRLELAAGEVRPGQHVRQTGENTPAGAEIGRPGVVITPALSGAFAAFGVRSVTVHRRVRVAIIVTGDEIVPVHAIPEAWQVRDSNGPSLRAMLASTPWIEPPLAMNSRDEPDALADAVRAATERADLVLLTGGISAGVHDHVPGVLPSLGARIVFRGVPQRPGRPVLGAVVPAGPIVIALPGNPVSVLVTARRMARPVAAALAGISEPEHRPLVRVRGHASVLGMWWHRLARCTAPGEVVLADTRGSGDLVSAALSDGFVEIPPTGAGEGPWPFYRWEW